MTSHQLKGCVEPQRLDQSYQYTGKGSQRCQKEQIRISVLLHLCVIYWYSGYR